MFGGIYGYVVAFLLAGALLLWGGLSVKSCVEAKHEAKVLEKAEEQRKEIEDADRKAAEQIQNMGEEEFIEFMRRGGGVMPVPGGVRDKP